jgi:hypothetical protein
MKRGSRVGNSSINCSTLLSYHKQKILFLSDEECYLPSIPYQSRPDWSSYHIVLQKQKDNNKAILFLIDLHMIANVALFDDLRNFFIASRTSFSIVHGDIDPASAADIF